jgi:hypothetical protein
VALSSTEQRRPYKRVVDDGSPLSELLGRAFADADGIEYQPPRVSELSDLLGADNFKQLMQSPRIAAAIKIWANAADAGRPGIVRSLAVLIADEVGRSDLEKRIAWEIGKLK